MITYYFYSVGFSNFLLLLAFIYGIYLYTKCLYRDKKITWYVIYLGFVLGIEIVSQSFIVIFESSNTQSIYPFYIAGEFFILLQLLRLDIVATKKWQIITGLLASAIFVEGMMLWFINNDASTGYGKLFSSIVIVSLVTYILIKNLRELETNNPFVIIYTALFLYYAVSIFLFLLMSQLTENTIPIWMVNNILSSILYGSSMYTFYKLKRSY